MSVINKIDNKGNPTDPGVLKKMDRFIEQEISNIDDNQYPTAGMKYKEAKRRFYEREGYGMYHPKFKPHLEMFDEHYRQKYGGPKKHDDTPPKKKIEKQPVSKPKIDK